MSEPQLRPFRREDAPEIVRIIREVFDEYGFIFDLEGYDSDLVDIAARYPLPHAFWTLEDAGRVIGCVGASVERDDVELHRLYIDRRARGRGIGKRLVQHVVAFARARGARRVFLWSDKRLLHAHEMYEREGFVKFGDRICQDPQNSPEWGYDLELS
jgi:N-acetylglutamate synthase-like GNAT family acetyltransferase